MNIYENTWKSLNIVKIVEKLSSAAPSPQANAQASQPFPGAPLRGARAEPFEQPSNNLRTTGPLRPIFD